MKEQEISIETAKLAKDVGFYIEGARVFSKTDEPNISSQVFGKKTNEELRALYYGNDRLVITVSQSLLQKWLREKYGRNIIVTTSNIGWVWSFNLHINSFNKKGFDDYELALEDALFEALKLI